MPVFARTLILAGYALVLHIPPVYAQTQFTKSFLTGRYDYTSDTSFIKVASRYSNNTVYLKKEAYTSYKKMYAAALKDGVTLNIISGTRILMISIINGIASGAMDSLPG